MTEQELNSLLKTIQVGGESIEVWYDHFVPTPTKPNVVPPFILFRVEDVDTLKADDKVHYQNNNYIVDLITDVKSVTLESQIETLFNDNYLPYDKQITYLSSEQIYQVRYFI